jgi:hypothetical protein
LFRSQARCQFVPMIRLTLSIVVLSALGCNDDATIAGDACEPNVSLSVSSTPVPEFTWQPDCGIGVLHVTAEGGGTVWQINSNPQSDFTPTNDIRSGVTYGTVPAGAQEFIPAAPLESGQVYQVYLNVSDSQGESIPVGTSTFTAGAP